MITLGLAILLATGLVAAKICQRLHLPSVTGYILAGLLLGPSGFSLITEHSIGHSLDHFISIALMLISFGIGEHIELRKLREHARSVAWIGMAEALATAVVVASAVLLTIYVTGFKVAGWQLRDYLALAILLGAVAMATAPAATLMVIRELKAHGPLTATLLAVVAIDNGLAIMVFGLAITLTHHIIGHSGGGLLVEIGTGFMEIGQSLLLGITTGICLDLALKKLKNRDEMMTGGLALLLLLGELAHFLSLSPLLAGMAAGFVLVNRADRDVRLFRALNSFEPPIYVLFFTIAGTHINFDALTTAGVIGTVYFISRIGGKMVGVRLGARFGNSPDLIRRYLAFGLYPQAGVAIGLIFLIGSDPALAVFAEIITPVVLTGVFFSELAGPVAVRYAVSRAGEIGEEEEQPINNSSCKGLSQEECDVHLRSESGVEIVPWHWEHLVEHQQWQDVVVFGAAHHQMVAGVARFATIFAHHYQARPMAVRVQNPDKELPGNLFEREKKEVGNMGYHLETELVPDHDVSSGLVAAAEYNRACAVVLGYPLEGTVSKFNEILEKVVVNVTCPVIVVHFYGMLHTERILIPVIDMMDLEEVYPIVVALDAIGEHQVALLYMLHSGATEEQARTQERIVEEWLLQQEEQIDINIRAVPTDSRVATIQKESEKYDLVVMGATQTRGVKKFFFGSLADSVLSKLRKTLLVVYAGRD